jgi:hypothetical protein
MTSREDYDDDEWKLLTDMPRLAAFGAMAAQDADPVTSTRELWAGLQELALSANSDYPDNALVQSVTGFITHHSEELTDEDWRASSAEALHERVVEQTLRTAASVRQLLAKRSTPEEAEEYKAWVMRIAHAGVEAARTGFLGLEGAEVTPREQLFISELEAALGAPRRAPGER